MNPSSISAGLQGSGCPFDYQQVGWNRSLYAWETLLPSIFQQPLDQTAHPGDSVSFSVLADRTVSIDWYKVGGAKVGTGLALTLNNVSSADAGSYVARISNSSGVIFSQKANLTLVTPVGPAISVEAASGLISNHQIIPVDFGTVQQGGSGPSLQFSISNTGGQDLSVGSISVPTGFILVQSPPSTVARQDVKSFVVQLDSSVVGNHAGQLSIPNNDPNNNPFSFPISGTVSSGGPISQTVATGGGPDVPIPDATWAGAPNTSAVVTHPLILDMPGAPAMASVDLITVTWSHTWVGDLTVELISPGNQHYVLFDRVPGGTGAYGSNLGVNGTPAPYQFASSGQSFEAAALAADEADTDISNSGVYAAQTWHSGSEQAGTWKISIVDNFPGDTGLLRSAEITCTPAPKLLSWATISGVRASQRTGTALVDVWDAGADFQDQLSTQMRIKMVVNGGGPNATAISPIFTLDTRAVPAGTLTGVVQAGGAQVANAQARIDGTGFAASTGSDGRFALVNVPAGSGYLLKVSAAGFASKQVPGITVTSGTSDLGTIQLAALSGPYRLVPLQPDVNPPVTQIEYGGVGYRYYRLVPVNANDNPGGTMVSLRVAGGTEISQNGDTSPYWPGYQTGTADGDGILRLRIPASAIGGPAASATLEVIESGTVKQTFTAQVVARRYDQVWKKKWHGVAGVDLGAGISVGLGFGHETTVTREFVNGASSKEVIGHWREEVYRKGVGVGNSFHVNRVGGGGSGHLQGRFNHRARTILSL